MGGHGGLNILPQKTWNVYNWDNRLKVKQDEIKAEEKANQKELKQAKKDLKNNYEILLQKKRQTQQDLGIVKQIKVVDDRRIVSASRKNPFEENEQQPEPVSKQEDAETIYTIKQHLQRNGEAWYLKRPGDMSIYTSNSRRFHKKRKSKPKNIPFEENSSFFVDITDKGLSSQKKYIKKDKSQCLIDQQIKDIKQIKAKAEGKDYRGRERSRLKDRIKSKSKHKKKKSKRKSSISSNSDLDSLRRSKKSKKSKKTRKSHKSSKSIELKYHQYQNMRKEQEEREYNERMREEQLLFMDGQKI